MRVYHSILQYSRGYLHDEDIELIDQILCLFIKSSNETKEVVKYKISKDYEFNNFKLILEYPYKMYHISFGLSLNELRSLHWSRVTAQNRQEIDFCCPGNISMLKSFITETTINI